MLINRRAYILRRMEINGERVHALMKRKGWSQAELARRAGVSQPTVWAMVHNQYRSPTSVHQVARALGVPVQILFEDGPLPENLPPPGMSDMEPPPYAAGTPLTVATFIDEGLALMETAFREEGLSWNARAAAVAIADWWILLTGERGLKNVSRIDDPRLAAELRAALAREVRIAVRTTRHLFQVTDSG